MRQPLRLVFVAVGLILCLPATASAATVSAHLVQSEEEGLVGPGVFTAARGEHNRLTITYGMRGLLFSDANNAVEARGDCLQVGPHRARCPQSEVAQVRLGDGDDVVRVRSHLTYIHGGAGDDVLLGGSGLDFMMGERGADVLRGGAGLDELRGGLGRDRLHGGAGDDRLIDGETDPRAARDRFDGGAGVDVLDYGRRRASLRVDLGRGTTSTEDRLRGLENITGGRGDDRLVGNASDNWLVGGPGDDLLSGGDGNDIPQGGPGEDRVSGDAGDDVVWGDGGRDRLFGGSGKDFMISREERGGQAPDALDCGDGADEARSGGDDALQAGCEGLRTFSNSLRVGTQPAIDHDSADFTADCDDLSACSGGITLTGPGGQAFGSARFDLPGHLGATLVSVPLNPIGAAALRQGAVVQVDVRSDAPGALQEPGGYRMLLRAATQ